METLQKIKDFCQDEINEFSVLGYEPSQYQLGYNSAINDIKEIYEEIPDQTQIEKLESEKKELLEALDRSNTAIMDCDWSENEGAPHLLPIYESNQSLIQKYKQ